METTPETTGGSLVEVHLSPRELGARVVAEVTEGLQAPGAWLPLDHLRDQRTADLWSELEGSEEYYQARSERGLVASRGSAAIEAAATESVVMLGPTAAGAIESLLEAAHRAGALHRFVTVGRIANEVEATCARVRSLFPALVVHGIVADPVDQLDAVTFPERSLVVISGPTIGHLERRQRARFLAGLAARLGPQDSVLLATDLTHDHRKVVAAYDDPGGLHAERARNALVVLAREFGAEVDPQGWRHVAHWHEADHSVDISLVADVQQRIAIPTLGVDRRFDSGEQIALERNSVFLRTGLDAQLGFAGLAVNHLWTDPTGDYALSLASR